MPLLGYKSKKSFKDVYQLHPECANISSWGTRWMQNIPLTEKSCPLKFIFPRLVIAWKAPWRKTKPSHATEQKQLSILNFFGPAVQVNDLNPINLWFYWCLTFLQSTLIGLTSKGQWIPHSSSGKTSYVIKRYRTHWIICGPIFLPTI